ncbi:hypothetical protein PILCRDRAFT_5246 [Piloderma croceum F 1598]|uniref:Uncharacterized protein n=1 Tax=Piloderma croceum (strain F 1598) TaxID=765440 RepID=A0A0C3BGX7_PILCF|nr:hypothetical protein PILCRDRAFT_5246 [Piloderma croceum F 1598]
MAACRVATTCGSAPASVRFRSAKSWAHYADDSDRESALDAYRAAIELLPVFCLDLQARQQALTYGSDGLARDAAAYAIRLGRYDMAAELLEEGRAVLWCQERYI